MPRLESFAHQPPSNPPNAITVKKPILLLLASLAALSASAAEPKGKSKAAATKDPGVIHLFNGKDLTGWKLSDFAAQGGVEVDAEFEGGPVLIVQLGEVLSGVTYTNPVPRVDYEITLDAMKLDGSDFFVGLTFPFKEKHATFVCGGWGGGVVGISSIDRGDASENETTKFMGFEKNKWYRIKVRVTAERIQAWIDDEEVANVETKDKDIDMRPGEIESAIPLGLSTFQTRAAYRNVVLKKLK